MLVGPPTMPGACTPQPGRFDGVRALDGAWLEAALADLRASVTYQHGLAETLAEVAEGRAAAAVLIRPVSVAEIQRTAREGSADATEVHVLHPQAQDRLRDPAPGE